MAKELDTPSAASRDGECSLKIKNKDRATEESGRRTAISPWLRRNALVRFEGDPEEGQPTPIPSQEGCLFSLFPFHCWLPRSCAGVSRVSCYTSDASPTLAPRAFSPQRGRAGARRRGGREVPLAYCSFRSCDTPAQDRGSFKSR